MNFEQGSRREGETLAGRPLLAALGLLLTLALGLRLAVGLGLPNLLWPDEIFQTLEPAHRLAFGYGIIPWEFRAGTRSWLLPGFLAAIMRAGAWLGPGSGPYLATVTAALCALSLLPVATALLWANRMGGAAAALIAGTIAAVWFELVYFAPKAFTEVVAAHLLLPALYLGHFDLQRRRRLIGSGLLLGIALGLRIQLAPAIACALIYICRGESKNKWVPLAGCAAAVFALCGLLDLLTWTYPFQSYWYGVRVNLLEGKSGLWGEHPWYHYLRVMAGVWSWAALPITALCLLGSRGNGLLWLVVAAIAITHGAVAHKEYRFIFPALPLLVVLAGCGLGRVHGMLAARAGRPWIGRAVLSAILLGTCLTSLSLTAGFDRSRTRVELEAVGIDHWSYFRAPLLYFRALSREQSACGLGLRNVHWALTGGYAYLHRDIPLFLIGSKQEARSLAPFFNYQLARGVTGKRLGDFVLQGCIDTYCLYRRPGPCERRAAYHINRELEKLGE